MSSGMSLTTSISNMVLDRWNALDCESAVPEILPCCGSRRWARLLAGERPFADPGQLFAASDRVWASLADRDWKQAFDSHPRIGQRSAPTATAESLAWSLQEQSTAMSRQDAAALALVDANRNYESRFGRIFIVCAAGRSAREILSILNARLNNTPSVEWRETGEQQRQITQLRLRKWLGVKDE